MKQIVRVCVRLNLFDQVSGVAAGVGLFFSSTLHISSSQFRFTLNKSVIYNIPTSFP